MKEGAYTGALVALLVYIMLPIYSPNGGPAITLIPAGDAVLSTTGFSTYVSNLPFSMIVFFTLEIIGISVGIISQMVLKQTTKKL